MVSRILMLDTNDIECIPSSIIEECKDADSLINLLTRYDLNRSFEERDVISFVNEVHSEEAAKAILNGAEHALPRFNIPEVTSPTARKPFFSASTVKEVTSYSAEARSKCVFDKTAPMVGNVEPRCDGRYEVIIRPSNPHDCVIEMTCPVCGREFNSYSVTVGDAHCPNPQCNISLCGPGTI